ITVYNSNYQLLNAKNNIITNGNLGTGYVLYTDDVTYHFIVKGDSNSDTFIDSGDLLRMVKHLRGNVTLSSYESIAAELTNDSAIDSGDLLRMVKYLKGSITSF
ncbi:MAG: hypothetical protein K5666_02565, partial [Bacilli bacterium]|nr:hypothetical protein [Bacilli bacterium]